MSTELHALLDSASTTSARARATRCKLEPSTTNKLVATNKATHPGAPPMTTCPCRRHTGQCEQKHALPEAHYTDAYSHPEPTPDGAWTSCVIPEHIPPPVPRGCLRALLMPAHYPTYRGASTDGFIQVTVARRQPHSPTQRSARTQNRSDSANPRPSTTELSILLYNPGKSLLGKISANSDSGATRPLTPQGPCVFSLSQRIQPPLKRRARHSIAQ